MVIEINRIHQKTIWAEDSNPLPNLPREIIVKILSRLPVKTLLRFRCVCRSWLSLISHSKFAQTHLSLASSDADYTHHRLLLRSNDRSRDIKLCSIFSIMNEQSDTAVSLDYPFDGSPWHCFVGSCNGLVCITNETFDDETTVFLWNPSTRKSRKLPAIGSRKSRKLPAIGMVFDERPVVGFVSYKTLCGFGYDESIDDYKIVLIFQIGANARECQNTVVVYTLRTHSWRRIGDLPPLHVAGSGKFASGALHWTTSGKFKERTTSGKFKEIIVSLDLAKETYGEVSQPDCVDYRSFTIDVLGGCLCMICEYDGFIVDLWVMKEYGTKESWTKLVVIRNPFYPRLFYAIRNPFRNPFDFRNLFDGPLTPKCILKNGDVLMGDTGGLVRYNPKDGKFRFPMIHKCFPSFSAYNYIESLVSPDADADTGA